MTLRGRSAAPQGGTTAPQDDDGAAMALAAEAGRRREALRADALRMLVEALLGRRVGPRESSVMLALHLAGALQRQLPADGRMAGGSLGETLRETALRRLVEAGLGRRLAAGEHAVGLALDLVAKRGGGRS